MGYIVVEFVISQANIYSKLVYTADVYSHDYISMAFT